MSLARLAPAPLDHAAAEAFATRIMQILDSGAVASMIALGHRTGLFDTMARLPPSSSAAIAGAARLSERYVREWLAVMVAGRVATYDPRGQTYTLPHAHAACLTHAAPLGNLAVYAQHVALIGALQDRLLDCFKTGEGTTYEEYPHFHAIMAEDSGQTVTAQIEDVILPLVEGLRERLEAGIDVLDAGCGRGAALIAMARRFPRSRFVGYDLGGDAIDFARKVVSNEDLANIRFARRDLSGFDEAERYDFIATFDAVHDQRDPEDFLRRLFAALRPGGLYLMQDIGGSARLENNLDFPMAAMLYAVSCMHCTPVSLGQGGKGLGTMWGWETAEAMLGSAGFRLVKRETLPNDPMNVWFVAAKD